jgi:predicted TIM-barrel fold metal-dependent hydrolase
MSTSEQDKFVAMVTAKAQVDLPISDFQPRSQLRTPVHEVTRPRFPVIDYHNHLDSLDPNDVLRIMDACDIEHMINITMQVGEPAMQQLRRYAKASKRFSTIAWADWAGVERDDFWQRSVDSLERMVEAGAVGFKIWKDLGLTVRDSRGEIVRVDDERLDPLYDKARELNIPIMFHTADPFAFFDPIDQFNERYEELAAHPDWAFQGAQYTKYELLEQRNNVFARHPSTQFVGAHIGECAEDLNFVSTMLDRFPNVSVDISARIGELGRQPYRAREFFLRYADRILFGADLLPDETMYRLYFRFLETADEYFEYPTHASRQGRWNVYGIFLPDDVLRKIYRDNALRILPPGTQ